MFRFHVLQAVRAKVVAGQHYGASSVKVYRKERAGSIKPFDSQLAQHG